MNDFSILTFDIDDSGGNLRMHFAHKCIVQCTKNYHASRATGEIILHCEIIIIHSLQLNSFASYLIFFYIINTAHIYTHRISKELKEIFGCTVHIFTFKIDY